MMPVGNAARMCHTTETVRLFMTLRIFWFRALILLVGILQAPSAARPESADGSGSADFSLSRIRC